MEYMSLAYMITKGSCAGMLEYISPAYMIMQGRGEGMSEVERDEEQMAIVKQDNDKPPKQTLRPPGVPSSEEFSKRG